MHTTIKGFGGLEEIGCCETAKLPLAMILVVQLSEMHTIIKGLGSLEEIGCCETAKLPQSMIVVVK